MAAARCSCCVFICTVPVNLTGQRVNVCNTRQQHSWIPGTISSHNLQTRVILCFSPLSLSLSLSFLLSLPLFLPLFYVCVCVHFFVRSQELTVVEDSRGAVHVVNPMLVQVTLPSLPPSLQQQQQQQQQPAQTQSSVTLSQQQSQVSNQSWPTCGWISSSCTISSF